MTDEIESGIRRLTYHLKTFHPWETYKKHFFPRWIMDLKLKASKQLVRNRREFNNDLFSEIYGKRYPIIKERVALIRASRLEDWQEDESIYNDRYQVILNLREELPDEEVEVFPRHLTEVVSDTQFDHDDVITFNRTDEDDTMIYFDIVCNGIPQIFMEIRNKGAVVVDGLYSDSCRDYIGILEQMAGTTAIKTF
ncbi:MAG: hypothetical protein KAT43_01010 [Nanoarchaeota archaeon]|nr:hypothetical protein [Nanoarchaeota archaeon]